MSSSLQTQALANAVLAACNPVELAQALIDPTDLLPRASGGYDVTGALAAQASINLREHGPGRTARIVMDTTDLTCTYTITLTDTARGISESVAYNATTGAPANLAALLTQWIAAIEADVAVDALITAEVNETDDGLILTWRSPIATGFALAQSSSAVLTVTLDYEEAVAYVFCRAAVNVILDDPTAASEAATAWQPYAYQGEALALQLANGIGWRQPVLPCAGLSALGFALTDLAGHADDGASGSGVTIDYRPPVAYVAKGVVS